MKIGLLGYKFENENLGCVALTYSTIAVLKKIFLEDLHIVNITNVHENMMEAQKYFEDIEITEQLINLKNHPQIFNVKSRKMIKSCDAILDITYGDNFSDIYLPDFVRKTTGMKLWVEKLGVPLILMPQTIGPFKQRELLMQAVKAIRNSTRVYSRDVLSKEFVKNYLPNKDVFVTTDLAFALPYERLQYKSNKCKVGLNVSGLLWNGGFHGDNQFGLTVDYKKYIISLIEELSKAEYEIHIIPHVTDIRKDSSDGDLKVTKYLKDYFPELIIAPTYVSPIDVKNYISSMDVFVGARMHSTIAAFSSQVPTIPFAYSRKFQGLYENIGYKYLIDGQKMNTKEALDLTISYINNRYELSNDVKKCMVNVQGQLENFLDDLKDVLSSNV